MLGSFPPPRNTCVQQGVGALRVGEGRGREGGEEHAAGHGRYRGDTQAERDEPFAEEMLMVPVLDVYLFIQCQVAANHHSIAAGAHDNASVYSR